jgi:hypothetical protein
VKEERRMKGRLKERINNRGKERRRIEVKEGRSKERRKNSKEIIN